MKKRDQTRSWCNECLQETNHSVLGTGEKTVHAPDDPDLWWSGSYEMVQCCGCDEVSLRLREFCSEDDEGGKTTIWPPRKTRRPPSWVYDLPASLVNLIQEVYSAHAADARALVAMGTRAIIDEVANDKVGDVGTFEEKLDALVDKELISSHQKKILVPALDAGSAASHRGYRPSPDIVEHLLDIAEHLLQAPTFFER